MEVTVSKPKLSFGFLHLLKLNFTPEKDRKFIYSAHFPLSQLFCFLTVDDICIKNGSGNVFFCAACLSLAWKCNCMLQSTSYAVFNFAIQEKENYLNSFLILFLLPDSTCSPTEGKELQFLSTNIYTSPFIAVFLTQKNSLHNRSSPISVKGS